MKESHGVVSGTTVVVPGVVTPVDVVVVVGVTTDVVAPLTVARNAYAFEAATIGSFAVAMTSLKYCKAFAVSTAAALEM